MSKRKYGPISTAIVDMCRGENGASLGEIAEALGRPTLSVSPMIDQIIKQGRLAKGGPRKKQRYFADPVRAAEFDKQAREEHAAWMATRRERKNETSRAWHKRQREEAKKAREAGKEPQAKPVAKPAPKTAAKPKIDITPRKSGVVLATKDQEPEKKKSHARAKVTWPEHVKVQVIPTPKDTRYIFEPPPGWRGEITKDWMNRRLQSFP